MSMLFKVEGKTVVPYTETLLVEPFKTIWERDLSPSKEEAIEDFKFIEFTKSMLRTNPFSGYAEEKKEEEVIRQCITREDWQPDELVIEAQDVLVDFQTNASPTYRFFMAAKIGLEKTESFFLDFDMSEVNLKTGNPIYKPRDITTALKDTSDILAKFDTMKEKVEKELFEVTKNRGMKIISPFADPGSI